MCGDLAGKARYVARCPAEISLARKKARTKKNPNERFGFNPPKEEVEETAEVANCCNR
jgi:hypothetical protein